MVNKKYVLIIILVMGVMAFSSPVSSNNINILDTLNITPFTEDTIVTIDDMNFNIPKGYGEDSHNTKDNIITEYRGIKFISFTRTYMNEDMDSIYISIFYDEQQMCDLDSISHDSGEVIKTIDGIDGLFLQEDGYCTFTYCIAGKIIMISAENESMISDIII